jgi:hypothetical protein
LPLQHERVGGTGSGKGKRDKQDSRQLASRDTHVLGAYFLLDCRGQFALYQSIYHTPEMDCGSTSKTNSHEKEILTYMEEVQKFLDQRPSSA